MKNIFLIIIFAVLCVGILFGLIRSILGPRRADRIMGINMIGSFSTGAIATLSIYLKEAWLLDVALVYCLISFLAVVILSKITIAAKGDKDND